MDEVLLNPRDYYHLLLDPRFRDAIDRETQRTLIRKGVVGYLWGAVLKVGSGLDRGMATFTYEA